jgi:predicted nucleic acid-binding protein
MRVAIDTNVLAYAEGLNGAAPRKMALRVLQALPTQTVVVPVQCLGELFNVLIRKAGYSRAQAHSAILSWADAFTVAETTAANMLAAAGLADQHQLNIWDAVVLATAANTGCRLLLSEDLQDGFTWNSTTIANPFTSPLHPLLDALLTNEE